MSRKIFIGGNWKCNGSLQSVKELVGNVLNKAEFDSTKVEVVVAPTNVHISAVRAILKDDIKVACQNMSTTSFGAFTGEISAE